MKLKERKENKSEKEVRPVKKSVALVLTIVTVFAFAAACFSLGFCSGKKVNEAYADITGQYYFYMSDTIKRPSQDYAATFASGGVDYASMGVNSDGYLCYTNPSSTVQVYNYNTNKWVNEKFRYLSVHGTNSNEFFQFFTSQSIMPEMAPVFYPGTFTMKPAVSFSTAHTYAFTFSSGGTGYNEMRTLSSGAVYYYYASGNSDLAYSTSSGWAKSDFRYITVSSTASKVCKQSAYMAFMGNVDSFSTSSGPEPVLYTCTLSKNTSGLYSFGYIEGDGVTYDSESETIKGPADSYFQVQLMPFEGYMVDSFLLTASNGYPKSIVKNSDILYTVTFEEDDFTLNISASVKIIEYTLTCEYEGEQNYSITYGMIGEITRNDNVFTGQPGASAYVRITPNDGYIMRSLSYQITDGSVASVTPGSSNNYTIVLTSSNATILFSVVATAQTVDISSGYYWLQCRYYGTDFSELTLQPGQFQIVESVSSSGIVWQDLTGLVCGAGKITFRLSGDKRFSVYTVTETHDDFSLSSGVVISNQGNIVAGHDYDYYSTLWAANWYPVIYVPSNIMEDDVSDALVSFFKSSSVYKAAPVYYSGFYLTKKDTIAYSNALYNTYLGVYVPVANTLVSPSSISFVPDSGGVSNITYKSALNFMGDVSSGEYVIYCGYDYKYNSTVSYNRVGRIPPAPRAGTYMESIYISPTIMPEKLYSLMARWFDIASGPVVPDPPPSSYWDGLDEVLSYEIFGIPLSSLLAIVISSVFVVVVIRLFAGG